FAAVSPTTQCAAVNTQSLSISVPVQNQSPGVCSSATVVGKSAGSAVWPPTIGWSTSPVAATQAGSTSTSHRDMPDDRANDAPAHSANSYTTVDGLGRTPP